MRFAVVVGLVSIIGCGPISTRQTQSPTVRTKVWTREAFEAAVIGKTHNEVLAILGKPTVTASKSENILESWMYNWITQDPDAKKPDFAVHIQFDDEGRVTKVKFD